MDDEEKPPVDQDTVTSTVKVVGVATIRLYSDGAVQRNIWDSEEQAQAYAASIAEQGG